MKDFIIPFLPVAALAVNVIAQICFFRLQGGGRFWRSVVLGALVGMVSLVLGWLVFAPDRLVDFILFGLPTYGALSYCFFNFANLGQASIRIRIYDEIACHPEGLAALQVTAEYDETRLIQTRVERLLVSGDIEHRDGSYFLKGRRFVPIARCIFAVKVFLLGKSSEFQ